MGSENDGEANGDATGQALVARELRRHRERAGLSRTELARRAGYSRTYISNCEKPGADLISRAVVTRIDDELGAGGVLIAAHQRAQAERQARRGSPAPGKSSPDRSGRPVSHSSGITGIGGLMQPQVVHPELLGQYESLTETYRQIDYQAGSSAVYSETLSQLDRLLGLADSVPGNLYQRFALALGDSAQLAAWLAIDRQDYNASRQYSSIALSSAQESENPTLHAYVLGLMSYVHLHAGRGLPAVRLLEGALRIADNPRLGVHPAVHSWLLEALGEAFALSGDRRRGAVSLANSERFYEAVDEEDFPAWLGFYNSHQHIQRLQGRCLVRLTDTKAAIRVLEEAIAALPAHYVRERSGTLIDLSEAHLTANQHGASTFDPDAAAVVAVEAWQLATNTASARNQRRIHNLTPLFEPHSQRAAVQSFFEAVS